MSVNVCGVEKFGKRLSHAEKIKTVTVQSLKSFAAFSFSARQVFVTRKAKIFVTGLPDAGVVCVC